MHRTFLVFLKCTIQGGLKVDVLLIAFSYLWLKFWEGIDKYRIVPVRKLFYFHHWLNLEEIKHKLANCSYKLELHSSYCLTYVIWSRNLRFTRKQSRYQTRSRRDGGLATPKQNYKAPNWNVKHYKSAEFRKLLESQAPPQTQSPPIENFLAAVPIKPFVNSIA